MHQQSTVVNCTICGGTAVLVQHYQQKRFRETGRAYCGKDCSKEYRRKISSETMSKTNLKYASERMKRNNPMRHKYIREKVSNTHKTIGHQPKIRGGNGRPPTAAEQRMADLIGPLGFKNQYVVKTGSLRHQFRAPTHYKIDLANPDMMIAVEIDGGSHSALSRREQDQRKTLFLITSGWRVLRFSNSDVMERTEETLFTILRLITSTHMSQTTS